MHFAGVRQPSFLFHRKRVKFGTQHDGWPGAIAEHRNHPGAANVLGHLIAQGAETRSKVRRSLRLMRRELRVLMQIEVERMRLGIHRTDFVRGRKSWFRSLWPSLAGGLSQRRCAEGGEQEKVCPSHCGMIAAAAAACNFRKVLRR